MVMARAVTVAAERKVRRFTAALRRRVAAVLGPPADGEKGGRPGVRFPAGPG
ncbi:hypothetical protein GCM10010350_80360 [Streptomyces galilaeus]|nr:hypothetical protein GCM10010350_80360 [Streptomyces galilaeus]